LIFLELEGITICALVPRVLAARLRAVAWFPEEWVATPLLNSDSVNDREALNAPLALKAPPRCIFSHLKNRDAPESSFKLLEVRTGVL
jgi:hypothetical protein